MLTISLYEYDLFVAALVAYSSFFANINKIVNNFLLFITFSYYLILNYLIFSSNKIYSEIWWYIFNFVCKNIHIKKQMKFLIIKKYIDKSLII